MKRKYGLSSWFYLSIKCTYYVRYLCCEEPSILLVLELNLHFSEALEMTETLLYHDVYIFVRYKMLNWSDTRCVYKKYFILYLNTKS